MQTKFALYNFMGEPVKWFLVDQQTVMTEPVPVKAPAHHIIILDVSGSMYFDLESVKSTVEKILTLEEFNDDTLRVSLLTYASDGDCKIHFEHVPVSEVMKPGSSYINEVRKLHTRGMTGISQALNIAYTLVHKDETTAISLHSDGWANDPSPHEEQKRIEKVIKTIKWDYPRAFCNTVAYRGNSDFKLLSSIANEMSGVCVKADDIKGLYKALHDTTTLVANSKVPTLTFVNKNDHDLMVFVTTSGRKVIGTIGDELVVNGIKHSDNKEVLYFLEVDERTYDQSQSVIDESYAPVIYAKVKLALGCLTEAKCALMTTRVTMLTRHYKALTGDQIASMTQDIEKYLFDYPTVKINPGYGISNGLESVMEIMNVLSRYKGSLKIDLNDMLKTYKRRGLKRVNGQRNEKGEIEKPRYKLVNFVSREEGVKVGSIDLNHNTANLNIQINEPAMLWDTVENKGINSVAGIDLNLYDYHNYTLVGDGEVNVERIKVKTNDKRCWSMLKALGLISEEKFDPEQYIVIDMKDRPVVNFNQKFSINVFNVETIMRLMTLRKLVNGVLSKAAPPARSDEQVEELKKHNLSANLYYNAPTVSPYTDLKDAIAKGLVDSRVSYKIDLGTTEVSSVDKLRSGNEYLQRRFECYMDGKKVEKPTLDLFLDGLNFKVKTLSSRTKLDGVDEVMMPIFQDILLDGCASLPGFLEFLGYQKDDIFEVVSVFERHTEGDQAVEILNNLRRTLERKIDEIYSNIISPAMFYIGSSGLVPEYFGKGMDAEKLAESYPEIKLSKQEKETGRFWVNNGVVLTVYTENAYFSTEEGVKAALAM